MAQIDVAIDFKKTAKLAKTWYIRGKIYYSLATLSETPSSSSEKITYNRISTSSFKKAQELDRKGKYAEVLDKAFHSMNEVYLNEGMIHFNAKDYTNAVFYFGLSKETAIAYDAVDTLAIFNEALSNEKLNNVALALEGYQECIDLKYGGAAIYDFKYILFSLHQRSDEARSILSLGLASFPNDVSLIRSQIKEYTNANEGDQAMHLIDQAINPKPQNAMLYLMRAKLSDKLRLDRSLIEADYQTAINLREDYFDANQKMGLFLYMFGMNEIVRSCTIYDKDGPSDVEEVGKAELRRAIPYLVKALDLKSYARSTLEALKTIYKQLEMTKKYDQICLQLKH